MKATRRARRTTEVTEKERWKGGWEEKRFDGLLASPCSPCSPWSSVFSVVLRDLCVRLACLGGVARWWENCLLYLLAGEACDDRGEIVDVGLMDYVIGDIPARPARLEIFDDLVQRSDQDIGA